ncbi:hypothetical protein TIFTF001_009261 [Ficus carica]|uniref:Epidermal patterning factor-like protein n=1 Tax=Ficus carica TaxID=3494 RepID=A0AA88AA55_FICCA|nr:hypothetical protein TIFTF001_009261 [Ficus carica]
MVVIRGGKIIGSRPPRCERRCRACGHCEAVQVPVVPQILVSRSRSSLISAKTTRSTTRAKNNDNYHLVADSRSVDFSNYKPMSWKCKCGDFLFNP